MPTVTIMSDVEKKEINTVTHITSTGTHVLYAVLLQHAGSLAGATVVEIGCGNGGWSQAQHPAPPPPAMQPRVESPLVEALLVPGPKREG